MNGFWTLKTHAARTGVGALLALTVVAAPTDPASAQNVLDLLGGAASSAGVPQIPAFLPDKYSVPETDPLPIDGVWMVSTIGKRIRIENGRAYAVDPWLHLFVLKVQPDMVVLQNVRRTASAGQFVADDLPLQGPASFQLKPDGNIKVTVQGMLGPVGYDLIRREPAFPDALGTEITAMTGNAYTPPPTAQPSPPPGYGAPPPEYGAPPPAAHPSPPPGYGAPPPGYDTQPPVAGNPLADCQNYGIDPTTGDVICMD
ncbi:MAG: hypothetical protein WD767_15840 [Alphaproteobacteria bacterium]